MSASAPFKTSASPACAPKVKVSVNSDAATGRLTLNQATRAQMDVGLGKRKVPAKPQPFSNSRPQPLTGLLGLSTCNSAFLNNLLADVKRAKEDILRANSNGFSPSIKRRRISMENGAKSVPDSPVQPTYKPFVLQQQPDHFLDLLWEESWLAPPSFGRSAAAPPALAPRAPPRATLIPATVSETFPAQQEPDRVVQGEKMDTTTSNADTEDSSSFGWYVDMDEDEEYPADDSHCAQGYDKVSSSEGDLAFSAPTAPKASNYDAEVEWAKAADTVDDVLGGLF